MGALVGGGVVWALIERHYVDVSVESVGCCGCAGGDEEWCGPLLERH